MNEKIGSISNCIVLFGVGASIGGARRGAARLLLVLGLALFFSGRAIRSEPAAQNALVGAAGGAISSASLFCGSGMGEDAAKGDGSGVMMKILGGVAVGILAPYLLPAAGLMSNTLLIGEGAATVITAAECGREIHAYRKTKAKLSADTEEIKTPEKTTVALSPKPVRKFPKKVEKKIASRTESDGARQEKPDNSIVVFTALFSGFYTLYLLFYAITGLRGADLALTSLEQLLKHILTGMYYLVLFSYIVAIISIPIIYKALMSVMEEPPRRRRSGW